MLGGGGGERGSYSMCVVLLLLLSLLSVSLLLFHFRRSWPFLHDHGRRNWAWLQISGCMCTLFIFFFFSLCIQFISMVTAECSVQFQHFWHILELSGCFHRTCLNESWPKHFFSVTFSPVTFFPLSTLSLLLNPSSIPLSPPPPPPPFSPRVIGGKVIECKKKELCSYLREVERWLGGGGRDGGGWGGLNMGQKRQVGCDVKVGVGGGGYVFRLPSQ